MAIGAISGGIQGCTDIVLGIIITTGSRRSQ
jgi:hypothetical protein